MEYWWLIIVIFLIFVEVETVNLTTIWFVVSGIASLLLSIFMDNLFLETIVFVIGGIVLMLTTKPLLQKYLKPKCVKTNIDRIIGMTGIALEDITDMTGEVKVDGKVWGAYTDAKEAIHKNDKVEILEIKSTRLKVKKVEE